MNFFDELFDSIEGFFGSLHNFYFSFGSVLFFALLFFVIFAIIVIITTSQSYEAKLIKTIDMFNNYFIDNPQINEDNLVNFNNKMKSNSVPKQLRKQWQQFVLYREGKASSYMSYENCVTNPIGNSGYKRDVKTLNVVSYIIATISFLLNCYIAYGDLTNTFTIIHLQEIVITPVIILLLNFILTIFFDSRHNAIVSDLYQNYQYFEVNIDKATQTLPDYVDYEVLFDKNEIKKGIPILYAYLQKRAEEEQKELERARLKNVEHEKFNFDDAGVAGSLVLERAMQEAENYIAERKKFNEDTEQINNDITTENSNYREITKEYNRQMQVSRETFENFKQQLEEVTSSIETNYLKKQQQQELDRQRNLERDFDTATEKHKKILESYQEELDAVDNERAKSRKTLEDAMMSEFASYSAKIYNEVRSTVNNEDQTKIKDLKGQIKDLEETISDKDEKLENAYSDNERLTEKYTKQDEPEEEDLGDSDQSVDETLDDSNFENELDIYKSEDNENEIENSYDESNQDEQDNLDNTNEDFDDNNQVNDIENLEANDNDEKENNYDNLFVEGSESEADEDFDEDFENENKELDYENSNSDENNEKGISTYERESIVNPGVEVQAVEKSKKKAGRPRKIVEKTKEKRRVGRPKKEQKLEKVLNKHRGRPRKNEEEKPVLVKKGRGRPRKEIITEKPVKKGRGRPKKVVNNQLKPVVKKGRGRPKKDDKPTSPKEIKVELKSSKRGRPKKEKPQIVLTKKGRGRPRKDSSNNAKIDDIDAYLKQIDEEIAKENERLKESRKQLVRNTKIKGKR